MKNVAPGIYRSGYYLVGKMLHGDVSNFNKEYVCCPFQDGFDALRETALRLGGGLREDWDGKS